LRIASGIQPHAMRNYYCVLTQVQPMLKLYTAVASLARNFIYCAAAIARMYLVTPLFTRVHVQYLVSPVKCRVLVGQDIG